VLLCKEMLVTLDRILAGGCALGSGGGMG
jgi:hypothetical protein